MKRCVVDGSVIAAAFFQEEYADQAERLLAVTPELFAPDLIHAEIANVIWKRFKGREIDEAEAGELLRDVHALSLRTVSCAELAPMALTLAIQTGQTAYDCLYLALAIKSNCAFLTADKRFWHAAMKHKSLGASVAWIGNESL